MTATRVQFFPAKGEQEETCRQHAGVRRAVYNAAIIRQEQHLQRLNAEDRWVVDKKTGEFRPLYLCEKLLSSYDLQKELNAGKYDEEIDWITKASKCVAEGALDDFAEAMQRWYKPDASGKRAGFPKFKTKKDGLGGFRLRRSDEKGIVLRDGMLHLPIIGPVRINRVSRWPAGRVAAVTITEERGRWWVSCSFDVPRPEPTTNTDIIGVDLGLKTLATLSTGALFENPKFLRKATKRLRRQQRAVSRRFKKGRQQSKNYEKAKNRLSRTHERVANLRRNAQHHVSAAIVKQAGTVVLESLNLRGMLQNHCLARSLSDAALGELTRQIVYKAERRGVKVLRASPFWPSSKRCHKCGAVKDALSLSVRVFRCDTPGCGWVCDRDMNAALNLSSAPEIPGALTCPKETGAKGVRNISRSKPAKSGDLESPRKLARASSNRKTSMATCEAVVDV